MPETRRLMSLAKAATEVRSYPELETLLGEAAVTLGFDYYAVTHYVADPLAANLANLTNFPERWLAAVAEKGYHKHNPIKAAVRKSLLGFVWSEIPTRVRLTPQQTETLEAARFIGLAEGFTVPAHLPGGVSGSVSFAQRPNQALEPRRLPIAHFFGCAAFEASLRISKALEFPTPPSLNLSTRQLDCVVLVARGKSDWEIGQMLNISKETAHKHIQTAMRRFNVVTRTQLVVRALYNAEMSFSDVYG